MELSKSGAAFVRLHEGFVANWYLDPIKVPTIGVGFTWRSQSFRKWWAENKPGVKFERGATMTREEAESALIYLFKTEYGKAVNDFYGRDVAQNVFDGTASVVYNCGPGSLKWQWAGLIKRGDIAGGAKKLETTAVTAKGKRLAGLVRRRREEAHLIRDGVYAGVFSREVVAKPDPLADGVLVRGEQGAAVSALIRDLAKLGYYKGTMDDLFGYGTEAALLAFQRDKSLKADGFAGPKTLAAIKAALAPVAPPKPVPAPVPVPEPVKPVPAPVPAPAPKKGFIAFLLSLFGK